MPSSTSRFGLSLGVNSHPSLTGSLFGLAKGLVYGADSGTLSSSRQHAWTTKHLPVFETVRSLVTPVDLELAAGQSRTWTYSIIIPAHLPPSLPGTAMRFIYEFSVAVAIVVGADGKQQQQVVKEVQVPITIWPYTAIPAAGLETCYDVLDPVVQRAERGQVVEGHPPEVAGVSRSGSRSAFERHVAALLAGEPPPPSSEDDAEIAADTRFHSAIPTLLQESGSASFEMMKDGTTFATARLARTRFAVGESIVGSLQVAPQGGFRIARFTATLVMNESVPSALLPPQDDPTLPREKLLRPIADFATIAIALDAFDFDLAIPIDATPSFAYRASTADGSGLGGISYSLKLRFLVFASDARLLAHDHSDSDHDFAASYLVEDISGQPVEATIPIEVIPSPCKRKGNPQTHIVQP